MKKVLYGGLLIGLIFSSYGQDSTSTTNDEVLEDLFELSLEELMSVPVTVATKTAMTQRESPGIISVVTREEIINSGARDMIDVLRLIPGVSMETDVEGVVGIGMRGNWAHEGKVLLLVDGQEMNENLFSTTQFGNHYDVTQIEKIEIVRGPGSSIYGGYAELGVINIITRQGKDLGGVQVGGTYGQMSDTYARRNLSVSVGDKKGDFEYSVSTFIGQGQRSQEKFVDVYGDENTMNGNSALNSTNVNIGLKYKGLSARYIYDNYKTTTIAFYDEVLADSKEVGYKSQNFELKYDWELGSKLTLTPKFNYIAQTPWQLKDTSVDFAYDVNANKIMGGLHLNYDYNKYLNLIGGVEFFNEQAKNKDELNSPSFGNSDQIDFQTAAAYLQALVKTKIVNVTLGGRVINHSQFGTAFAPRIGVTKVINKFHAKLLYSGAYRAPGIENINLNPNITPETTDVLELEVGYRLTKKLLLQANVFDITIKNPIVYFYNEDTDEESYENFHRTGSRGFEIETRFRDKWGYVNLNYSFYSTAGKNDVDYYVVPGNENVLLGFPAHKLNLNSSFKVMKGFSVNPSASWIGKRYQYASVDVNDETVISENDDKILLNLFFNYSGLVKGLNIGLGVYDILGQNYDFIQPYNGYHAPLPGTGREYVLRVIYNLPFTKK